MANKPLTKRHLELLAMPSIESQLPVKFDNGNDFSEFVGVCKGCDRDIPDDLMRGSVTRQTQRCFTIEAVGACPHCMVGTPYLLRMYDDCSLVALCGNTWQRYEAQHENLLSWMGGLVQRIFGTRKD